MFSLCLRSLKLERFICKFKKNLNDFVWTTCDFLFALTATDCKRKIASKTSVACDNLEAVSEGYILILQWLKV